MHIRSCRPTADCGAVMNPDELPIQCGVSVSASYLAVASAVPERGNLFTLNTADDGTVTAACTRMGVSTTTVADSCCIGHNKFANSMLLAAT